MPGVAARRTPPPEPGPLPRILDCSINAPADGDRGVFVSSHHRRPAGPPALPSAPSLVMIKREARPGSPRRVAGGLPNSASRGGGGSDRRPRHLLTPAHLDACDLDLTRSMDALKSRS